ncbi:MAG: hypothetical protein QOC97_985 [Chloroflexota bacterium]|nr:hypothetical protein [Chloroflexota bacterium]
MSRGWASHPGRVAGTVLAVVLWLALALAASAASPSPGPATGGDPRSSGQGPGLVGDPAFALLAVVAIGLGTVAGTFIYVRLTNRS